jgi:hypothetical protein
VAIVALVTENKWTGVQNLLACPPFHRMGYQTIIAVPILPVDESAKSLLSPDVVNIMKNAR